MSPHLRLAVLITALTCASAAAQAPERPSDAAGAGTCDPAALGKGGFDEKLARTLGADEHGMRRYVIAFLHAGPNRDQPEAEAVRLQKAHLDNIARLAREGTLVLAGPFLDDGDLRGIYVFAADSVEDARRLTETDPAIQAGRLRMELHPWYGSAALGLVNAIHERITAKRF